MSEIKQKIILGWRWVKKKAIWFFVGGVMLASVGVGIPLFYEGTQVYEICDIDSPVRISIDSDLRTLKIRNPDQSFRELNTKEKGSLKGCEIAKIDFRGEYISQKYGVKIDIQSIKAIEGGVEIMARAWRGAKQLGFGKDGSVEIEKFRFINPPILVDDPNGTIIREWAIDLFDGSFEQNTRKLREDPAEAIRQDLAHTIIVGGGRINTNIIKGKRGSTHTTYHPAAGANYPVDGLVSRQGALDETWNTLRTSAGNDARVTNTIDNAIHLADGPTTDRFKNLSRGIYLFDTSDIPDDDAIDSAILSLFGSAKLDETPTNPVIDIYTSSPASDDNLVSSDYAQLGATSQTGSGITFSNFSTSAYNDFTLNSTGRGNISQTATTSFGSRSVFDADNVAPAWGAEHDISRMRVFFADEGGTTKDPKLVVEHSSAASKMMIISWFEKLFNMVYANTR